MRNQWRLLLQRCKSKSQIQLFGSYHHYHFKVHSSNPVPHCSFSSILHSRAPYSFENPNFRPFSSSPELAVEQNKFSDQATVSKLIELFSNPSKTNEDVMLELGLRNIVVTDDLVNELFKSRGSNPDTARKFFDWVMEKGFDNLSSNSFNWILGMLGGNGLVKEFWDLADLMKKKGYGVKKGAWDRAMAKFEEEGLEGDVQRLKELFATGSMDASVEKVSSRVCKIIRQELWGDDVEKKLQQLGVEYSSDLVKLVLENLGAEPNKAFIYFRWIEESGLFKHDEKTYNAMARELAREDYTDKFWKLIDEMRAAGYDMEKGTYIKGLNQFVKNKMLKDAVDLYEFAMGGNHKPSVSDCVFLLRKIVTSTELDMDLFSKVIRIFKEGGNTLTDNTLNAVLKSLNSVGRFEDCNKILGAMKEIGFVPGEKLREKIAFQLSKKGKTEAANEFLADIETSVSAPSYQTRVSLMEGHCVSGHLNKVSDCFREMIEKEGVPSTGYALERLISAYCSKGNAVDGYKLLLEVFTDKEIKPSHATYKLLICKLLDQGAFKEATNLLDLMKSHRSLLSLDPFIKYVAKTGTVADAIMFLKAMSRKKFPSTDVYLSIFEAYFEAGRQNEAQEFLSRSPRHVRNNADVLNLFYSMKSDKDAAASTVAIA